MKANGVVDIEIHIVLTSALAGGEWSPSYPCRFTPGERAPGTHWIGGWMGARAGLDDVEKRQFLTLPGLELLSIGRPARSQSLYRLSYPGSKIQRVRPENAPRRTTHGFTLSLTPHYIHILLKRRGTSREELQNFCRKKLYLT
jgi:hypothetical protein